MNDGLHGPAESRAGYRLTAHTADAGIEAWGASPGEALAQAAAALFSLMCPLDEVHPVQKWSFSLQAPSLDLLLVDLLDEAIFLHEVELAVFKEARVQSLSPAASEGFWRVEGYFAGEKIDTRRHHLHGHVKAVTLHGLSAAQKKDLWYVTVIVDL